MTDDPWALCHLDDSFDSSVLGIKGAQLQWCEDRDSLIAFLLEDFIDLLADVGEFMTLQPGDVIACGTSLGVLPIKPGTLVEVSIDGIGVLKNTFVQTPSADA